ncbi:MAG: efflux RND transporter periplasmic adaptor subunit [Bacteroidales bacterium]|nr:efflux RND transporter periplasmic adaptor subunit [Candidatus Latescibacterota bacterium]
MKYLFKTNRRHIGLRQAGVAVVAILLSLVMIQGCGNGGHDSESGPEFKKIPVKRGIFQISVSANGEVKPIDRVEMKSKASGMIMELPIEEGDFVRKGDLIARLDQKDELAAVNQAQADVDIARAELKQATRSFNRREKLFKQNYISEEENDQIELSLAIARGKLIQAETILDRASERLAEATVRAPIDGVILQKYVEEGQIIVSGISNVSGGTAIADIADMSRVHIEAGIDEIDIGKIEVGQTAAIMAEAYPGLSFNGLIARISPEAKIEQNVTLFDIITEVENHDGRLKSGMNASVQIIIVRKEDALLVPSVAFQAVRGDGSAEKGMMVLLWDGDSWIEKEVETGLYDYRNVEIISGLSEGDILGVPMTSRLKEENLRLEQRIRRSRSFGADKSNDNKKNQ